MDSSGVAPTLKCVHRAEPVEPEPLMKDIQTSDRPVDDLTSASDHPVTAVPVERSETEQCRLSRSDSHSGGGPTAMNSLEILVASQIRGTLRRLEIPLAAVCDNYEIACGIYEVQLAIDGGPSQPLHHEKSHPGGKIACARERASL